MSKKNLETYLPTLPVCDSNNGKSLSPIWETHCHLDMLKETNVDELISNLEHSGIERITTIATSKKNFEKVVQFSNKYQSVYFTLGTHPHEAKDFDEKDFKFIREAYQQNKKLIAVGEIGLDYFYDFSPREKQIPALEKQLELSIELNLPVVIHNRESDEDMISALKNFKGKARGVIHSFSSGQKLAEEALDLGFYLGFNGMATFKTAENVRSAIEKCPIERILIETDAPFLTPTPFRGRENNSRYLPIIAQKIIELKGLDPEEGLKTIYQNSLNCFNRA